MGINIAIKQNCHSISENMKVNNLGVISRKEDEVIYLSYKTVVSS